MHAWYILYNMELRCAAARFRFAPSRSRAFALWKWKNKSLYSCMHDTFSTIWNSAVLQLDSASLHLARGHSPYENEKTRACIHACMIHSLVFSFSHSSLTNAQIDYYIISRKIHAVSTDFRDFPVLLFFRLSLQGLHLPRGLWRGGGLLWRWFCLPLIWRRPVGSLFLFWYQ